MIFGLRTTMKCVVNHEKIKSMVSGETIWYCKVIRMPKYHVPIKLVSPEKFIHHVLLLFCPFRDEKELSSVFPQLYWNKFQQQVVKFEPYSDLDKQTYFELNETLIENQDPHNQTENNEASGPEYSHENDSGDTEENKTSAITHFMPKTLLDDCMAEGINSLNSKQGLQFGSYWG